MSIPTEPGYYWLKTEPESDMDWEPAWKSGDYIRVFGDSGLLVDEFRQQYPRAQWGPRIEPPSEAAHE